MNIFPSTVETVAFKVTPNKGGARKHVAISVDKSSDGWDVNRVEIMGKMEVDYIGTYSSYEEARSKLMFLSLQYEVGGSISDVHFTNI